MTSDQPGSESPQGIHPVACPIKLAEALEAMMEEFFETKSEDFLRRTREKVCFLEVPAGAILLKEGDRDDDVYFVLRGRLRAVKSRPRGRNETLGEIGRGETIGELALLLGEPRSATIVALRDSIVARLGSADFQELLTMEPKLVLTMARGVIQRYRHAERMRQPPRKPVNVCFLALHPDLDTLGFASVLAEARQTYGGQVPLLDGRAAAKALGLQEVRFEDRSKIVEWVTRMEATSESLFLVADPCPSAWTALCVCLADEIFLLADADHDPALTRLEQELFEGDRALHAAMHTLVLLHDPAKKSPRGTARWLDNHPVHRHFHFRRGHAPDLRRLARVLAGRAVGFVLAGGGARAFVHFGVINALGEAGIEPDFLGGTSMGATAAGWRAMDLRGQDYVDAGRKVYLNKPTSDINPLPMLSVIRGRRVRRITEEAVTDTAGSAIDIEDTWIPFFCIATNLSLAEQAVLQRGSMAKSLLASFSIPGALPPILIDGQLMVDGGTFNNFPVDVMESQGVGKIIGVVASQGRAPHVPLQELPDNFSLLLDSLRPAHKRRYKIPLLPEILLSATISSSVSRQRLAIDRVDLLFQPKVHRIGLLEWEKYDEIIREAHEKTREELVGMDPAKLDEFR